MREEIKYAPAIKNSALAISLVSSFVTPFMGSAINVALPTIGKQFNADAIALGWVATAYLLSTAVFLVPFGRLADIAGRKKIYLIGTITWGMAALLSGFAPTLSLLIVARVIQGIGSAMVFGTGMAIITSVFPVGERGKILGINVASTYTGLAIGPFIGGLITHYWDWRVIFFMTVPLSIVITALVIGKLKAEWADAKNEKFDYTGSLIYGVSIAAVMYGFSQLPGMYGGLMIFGGVAGIVGFILWELKSTTPIMNMQLFVQNRVFAFSNLAALINYCATFAVGFLLSFYLQKIKAFDAQKAGFILVAQPVVMALFSPLMGRLSDKVQPRIMASIGMALATIGLSFLAFITETTSIKFIIADLVLLGMGFAFFSSPNVNAIMSSVEKKYYGLASGTLSTMRMLGQMFSMGIAMLLFSLFIGHKEILPENYPAFIHAIKIAFLIFAVLCFVGIFFSFARGKRE